MKFAILAFSLFAIPTRADAPKQIHWGLQKVFVPVGFDDNDRVQVTVQGTFDSTCLKVGSHNVEAVEEKRQVLVDQKAYLYQGICLQIKVPFTQTLDLGLLPAGDWTIVDANSGKNLGALKVAASQNGGPDDFLYAPISDAYVQDGASGGKTLCLKGSYSDRCTKLKEVKVNYASDVIVVQPVAEHLGGHRDCAASAVRFSHCETLPDDLMGEFLLHVRSMNGQAINKIIDLR